jgi:hypothetical protein
MRIERLMRVNGLPVDDSASDRIKKGHLEMPHMDSAVGSACYRGAFLLLCFLITGRVGL